MSPLELARQSIFSVEQQRIATVETGLQRLRAYILAEDYYGFDPFDALTAPVFSLPLLRSNKLARFGTQQILKRSPLNLRRFLGIRKGLNPVTYGLCLHAFVYLLRVDCERENLYLREIERCLSGLENGQSRGYSGACWGYDFDWEARYAKIPAFTPTVVATGFITNALFEYYLACGDQRAFELCESAAKFVLNDLNKLVDGRNFCYSYSPLDRQVVLNATMKGARLLAQVYSVTRDAELRTEARNTVEFVMHRQQQDGAWSYAVGDARKWVDNFHTAYILDSLDAYMEYTGDKSFATHFKLGFNYYLENFFEEDGRAKYYAGATYPIDATAAAQSILTLSRFGHEERAFSVAAWMMKNMQAPDGFFYFQHKKFFRNKISYMRWSNAWMFLALAYLLFRLRENQPG